jgi:hypothetical protein
MSFLDTTTTVKEGNMTTDLYSKSPLSHHLKRRGYNDKVIESGFSKASEINRNNLLEYKEKKINKRVPLVLTWLKSPSLCLVVSTVEHNRFTLMAWLNGILLKQCLGGNYWVKGIAVVVMLPSLTVVVVSRKDIRAQNVLP